MKTDRRTFNHGLAACALAGFSGSAMAASGMSNPMALGFRQPEEADPHERTFMQWPNALEVYKNRDDLEAVQEKIALIADTIARYEPVVMLADAGLHDEIGYWLSSKDIELWDVATEDLWCRDAGPLFLLNGRDELAAANLNFNGWGQKQKHDRDGRVAQTLLEKMGVHEFNIGVVGEPGGIEFDGEGTLIAHESSWLNPNRNSASRDVVTRQLKLAYGAQKLIWAKGVYGQDITDYHIDALARFVEPGVILIQLPDEIDPADPWSAAAWNTYRILKDAVDHAGRKFEIVVIPEPLQVRSAYPDFVASYVNYYLCNGAVIAAEFGDDKADAIAAKTLGELYPGREIVLLNVDAIGEAGGGIHCATQQQPASAGIWTGTINTGIRRAR